MVFALCLYTSLFSQTIHAKSQQLIDTAAATLCNCFEVTFNLLDGDVKELVKGVFMNPDSGQQNIQSYLQQVSKERSDEVILQLQKLGSIDSDLNVCFDRATHIFEDLPCGIEELSVDDQLIVMKDFESEKKTIDLLMESLTLRAGCEFAYQFIKLGLELEQRK